MGDREVNLTPLLAAATRTDSGAAKAEQRAISRVLDSVLAAHQ
jgi:hypothetical protein